MVVGAKDELGASSERSCTEQTVPDRKGQHRDEDTDYEDRRQPIRRLVLAPDPDHHPRDVIGASRLGAPEPVVVGGEAEFALGVGAAGYRRLVRLTGGERAYLGVHHRFAIRGRELGGDLMLREKIDRTGRRCGEKIEGRDGAQQQSARSARPYSGSAASQRRHAINIAIFLPRATPVALLP